MKIIKISKNEFLIKFKNNKSNRKKIYMIKLNLQTTLPNFQVRQCGIVSLRIKSTTEMTEEQLSNIIHKNLRLTIYS